jgi:hypothetical protein
VAMREAQLAKHKPARKNIIPTVALKARRVLGYVLLSCASIIALKS